MKSENLIKFTVLSRFLSTGAKKGQESVRKNSIPKIHESKVKELLEIIQEWIKKHS